MKKLAVLLLTVIAGMLVGCSKPVTVTQSKTTWEYHKEIVEPNLREGTLDEYPANVAADYVYGRAGNSFDLPVEKLNQLGQAGWELVSTVAEPIGKAADATDGGRNYFGNVTTKRYVLLFKRPTPGS